MAQVYWWAIQLYIYDFNWWVELAAHYSTDYRTHPALILKQRKRNVIRLVARRNQQ